MTEQKHSHHSFQNAIHRALVGHPLSSPLYFQRGVDCLRQILISLEWRRSGVIIQTPSGIRRAQNVRFGHRSGTLSLSSYNILVKDIRHLTPLGNVRFLFSAPIGHSDITSHLSSRTTVKALPGQDSNFPVSTFSLSNPATCHLSFGVPVTIWRLRHKPVTTRTSLLVAIEKTSR